MAKIIVSLIEVILNAIASAIVIYIALNIMGFDIVRDNTAIKGTTTEKESSFPHHRWCYESKDLKPDDFCIQGITYREYRSYSDDPMMNFRLYGVKLGEESRAAVAKGETRILGGEKVPICKVADKYNARFCYNDETMEANLVAKNDKGQTVIVSAVDYHDISKGYSFELVTK